MKNSKAITLISLVLTIIVILILSTITVNMVTGENGIIKNTNNAKEQTEIANEKEIIQKATVSAMNKDKYGDLTQDELQNQLDKEQEGKTEVTDVGEEFEILFKESNRYYTVEKDGSVSNPQKIVNDSNPGDITKGGTLDGTEEKPYEINCIEDLVAFSNMTNGTGVKFENGKVTSVEKSEAFRGKKIILKRDLNFKSKYSYINSERTDFGDLNTNETVETIKEELTKTDEGCIGFTPIGLQEKSECIFFGIFNGNGFEIANIYINNNKNTFIGLFGRCSSGEIKNLTISGDIMCDNDENSVGGICGDARDVYIENCQNNCNIYASNTGGICGRASGDMKITNCRNEGKIKGNKKAGGIVAYMYATILTIKNSYNIGKIYSINYDAGGIMGGTTAGNLTIYNCYNTGEVTRENSENSWQSGCGGILGFKYLTTTLKIVNCVNLGKCNATANLGGILGFNWGPTEEPEVENCYYKNENGIKGEGINTNTQTIAFDNISNEIIDNLNAYIEKAPEGIDAFDWKKWRLGESGYPEFE